MKNLTIEEIQKNLGVSLEVAMEMHKAAQKVLEKEADNRQKEIVQDLTMILTADLPDADVLAYLIEGGYTGYTVTFMVEASKSTLKLHRK